MFEVENDTLNKVYQFGFHRISPRSSFSLNSFTDLKLVLRIKLFVHSSTRKSSVFDSTLRWTDHTLTFKKREVK